MSLHTPPEIVDTNAAADLAALPLRTFLDHGGGTVDDLRTACVDLIADLLHFALREGHNPIAIVNDAHQVFVREQLDFPHHA